MGLQKNIADGQNEGFATAKQSYMQKLADKLNKNTLAVFIGVCMCLFHLYTGAFGTLEAMLQRSIHLAFVLVLVFLVYPASKKTANREKLPIYDWIFAIGSVITLGYILVNFEYLNYERIYYVTPLFLKEKVLGILLILLLLEAARRTVGLFLSTVAAAFVAYVVLGPYLPGILNYPGTSVDMFLDLQFLTPSGIFGIPLGISATYIVLFIIFGAFMLQTGFGEFLTDVATKVAGRTRGGPAKVSVFASAMFGTITGSGSANVAVTGTFTIPMMIKGGFKRHFAGAVEACASTGGQIMPPIMGAAAFIMAEFSGIAYIKIIKHALIPALLYFASVFFTVDIEAAKNGIRGLRKDEMVPLKGKVFKFCHLAVPIMLLLWLMIIGRSPFYAATISIFCIVVFSFFRKATRFSRDQIILALWNAAKGTLLVAVACAIAGLVIGCIYITGIGDRFVGLVVKLSAGHLIIALFFAMISALILGMGMPTSAAYILMAALIIPALTKLGIGVLQANMFAFYFACLSLVTPPVATASYVAAAIAEAHMTRTGWVSAKIAAAGYIVPFMFVYEPALLFQGPLWKIILATTTAMVGIYALTVSLQGFWKTGLNLAQRILTFIAAVLMMFPGMYTDGSGLIILIGIYFLQRIQFKKAESAL